MVHQLAPLRMQLLQLALQLTQSPALSYSPAHRKVSVAGLPHVQLLEHGDCRAQVAEAVEGNDKDGRGMMAVVPHDLVGKQHSRRPTEQCVAVSNCAGVSGGEPRSATINALCL